FPNNEENELAKKLIGKVGGTTTVLHTPITRKNYSATNKNNKNLRVNDNILKRVADTYQDTFEDISESDSKMNKYILCVDDNSISLENTLRQVSKLGYSTISATNGLEAVTLIDSKSSCSFFTDIDQIKSHKISLILTEYNLPMMSGFEASQAIRAMKPPISSIPIIVLTALPVDEIRNRCIKSGINDYLAKPLKIEELEKVLTKWISKN
ncbi:29799_t:CDS:2, partial [Racocetra persica]